MAEKTTTRIALIYYTGWGMIILALLPIYIGVRYSTWTHGGIEGQAFYTAPLIYIPMIVVGALLVRKAKKSLSTRDDHIKIE